MAGRGPAPKEQGRRRTNVPTRGEWQASPGIGWQHGPIPEPPGSLGTVARATWQTWFASWFAANWSPDNLPQIEHTILLLEQCRKAFADPYVEHTNDAGTFYTLRPNPSTELRQWMDGIGASFKGQQDRRWRRPDAGESAATPALPTAYQRLAAVK